MPDIGEPSFTEAVLILFLMLFIGPQSVPSILDQTPWPCGFYHFRDAMPENEYFNPSIVTWRDRDYLIVRRREGPIGKPGRNTLEAWLLKHNEPARRHRIAIPVIHPQESHEDPRAFVRGETIIVSCCNFVPGDGFAHQCMFGLYPDFKAEIPLRLKFGHNGEQRGLNTGHEKNWSPFLHDGCIHISYSFNDLRHVVLKTKGGKPACITYGIAPRWEYGALRGGTPPVRVGDLYWTFFHSSVHWYCGKRQYFMGALAFETAAPFHVRRMTAKPLLVASDRDHRQQHAPPCVFPGGALFRDNHWHVVLGVNDNSCAWIRIPGEELERRCYVC